MLIIGNSINWDYIRGVFLFFFFSLAGNETFIVVEKLVRIELTEL